MAYRERWEAEVAQMRRVLAGFEMKEECRWGKPTCTVGGKNVVIMQGFKEYFGLGFFQGALLKDPRKLLVQLGLGIGWLDLHTTEAVVTILALLVAGLLLGLLQPTGAWRWAVLLALGLPAMAVVGRLLRVHTVEPVRLDPRIALVAVAFALVGCYSGVVVRRILARLTTSG